MNDKKQLKQLKQLKRLKKSLKMLENRTLDENSIKEMEELEEQIWLKKQLIENLK